MRRLNVRSVLIWSAVAVFGAVSWGFVALCSYAIAYCFYARFVARRVLQVDDSRATPAERLENGIDYNVTDRRVLFGHQIVPGK